MDPKKVAVAPNAINTKENPTVNKIIGIKFILFFLIVHSRNSLKCKIYILELEVKHMVTKNLLIQRQMQQVTLSF